ncbi:MAG: MATE family efflux transporter, partial [Rhodospirillaceae bacterium]
GGAIGAKKRAALRKAVKVASLWAVLIAVDYALVYAILGEVIIAVLTGMEDVRNIAGQYLPWIILSPAVSVWSFMLDGVFIGATFSREMRNGMMISLVLFAGLTLILKPLLGYHGVWLAFILFMTSRAVTLGIFYPRVERAAIKESA